MHGLELFIVIAILIEGVVEWLKDFTVSKVKPQKVAAVIIAVLVALTTRADVFVALGIPSKVPYVGCVLTGLLISRGANYFHDLWDRVNRWRKQG
ncbi:MAG: hypothetical protein ACUVRF_09170 [Desulfotomaculales bacterium]